MYKENDLHLYTRATFQILCMQALTKWKAWPTSYSLSSRVKSDNKMLTSMVVQVAICLKCKREIKLVTTVSEASQTSGRGCVRKTRKRKRLEDRMARGKVQMRRIENPVHRQVTFCKRRMGLLKKAKELSVLCDATIGVIVISPHGKIYDLATNGNMQGLIERYRGTYSQMHGESSNHNKTETIKQEVFALTHELDLLQKGFRYMHGEENDINDNMNLDELQTLESNLEMWVNNIRSQKMQIISREIEMLRNKEAILQAVNGVLQERIIEQNGILNVSNTAMTPQAPFQLTMESNYYF